MGAFELILVTLVAFVAGMASVCDERQFHRPLVACTLTGLVMGDLTTGIAVGGALELIALGWMNVGAAMAPDAALASTISTVIAVQSGGGQGAVSQAIAIAVPLAVAGQALTIFVRTIAVFFQHQADRFAESANFRGIEAMHFSALALQGLRVAIPTAIVGLVSQDAVQNMLNSIPEVITRGLQVAGGFIVVVGYAMVINMMKARSLMPFFFLGFVISTFMTNLNAPVTLVALGIIGVCLAVVYIQLNPQFHDAVRLPAQQPATVGAGASDDLDDELD